MTNPEFASVRNTDTGVAARRHCGGLSVTVPSPGPTSAVITGAPGVIVGVAVPVCVAVAVAVVDAVAVPVAVAVRVALAVAVLDAVGVAVRTYRSSVVPLRLSGYPRRAAPRPAIPRGIASTAYAV